MNRRQRHGWIGYCLKALGRFGVHEKKAFSSAFGISEATLSRDQTAFIIAASAPNLKLECGKLKLDETDSLELPEGALTPDLNEWLRVIIGQKFVTLPDVVRARPSDNVIGCFVRSIQDRRTLFMLYVSRTAAIPEWRAVSPHTIVDIAGRYHARCFDHMKGRYADFVLSRVTGINFDRTDMPTYIDGHEDLDWHKQVKLRISVRDASASSAVMLDYGITNGFSRVITVRKALTPYITNRRRDGFDDLVEIHENGV